MIKTNKDNTSEKLAVDTKGLQSMLDCGRMAAVEIGTRAGARFKVGRRVLWNVTKVQNYINELSGQGMEV